MGDIGAKKKSDARQNAKLQRKITKTWESILTSLSGHAQDIPREAACLSRESVRCAPREHDKCAPTRQASGKDRLEMQILQILSDDLSALTCWVRPICRCRNDRCAVALGPEVLEHKTHTYYSC